MTWTPARGKCRILRRSAGSVRHFARKAGKIKNGSGSLGVPFYILPGFRGKSGTECCEGRSVLHFARWCPLGARLVSAWCPLGGVRRPEEPRPPPLHRLDERRGVPPHHPQHPQPEPPGPPEGCPHPTNTTRGQNPRAPRHQQFLQTEPRAPHHQHVPGTEPRGSRNGVLPHHQHVPGTEPIGSRNGVLPATNTSRGQNRRALRPSASVQDQRSIPAMVAVMKAASEPAIMARSPSRERSCRRLGAIPPIPPIWMAMELKLANPDSA